MLRDILLASVSLFIAVDPIGLLPIFISLTEYVDPAEKRKVILQSILTAFVLAISFIFVGRALFRLIGITVNDFLIAGGAILFCISIIDIVNPVRSRQQPSSDLGVVPLGTPLIVGPAVLTTSIILVTQYGIWPTLVAVIINISLAGVTLLSSEFLMKILGKAGSKAVSKIISLLLGAIAVMMIRKGIAGLITEL